MGKRLKMTIALMLTFAAGVVDIVGFLLFYSTFTAHMTGVTVHMGDHLATAQYGAVAFLACVLAAFVIGAIVGRTIVQVAVTHRLRSAASLALLVEGSLILAVALLGANAHPTVALTVMLAAAMGLQTATLTRIGPLTVHTTFVTGMLNKLAQLLSHALFLSVRRLSVGTRTVHDRRKVLRQAAFIFSIWLVYFFGAVAGAAIKPDWAAYSLVIPAAIVFASAAIDVAQPLSIEEERDESER